MLQDVVKKSGKALAKRAIPEERVILSCETAKLEHRLLSEPRGLGRLMREAAMTATPSPEIRV